MCVCVCICVTMHGHTVAAIETKPLRGGGRFSGNGHRLCHDLGGQSGGWLKVRKWVFPGSQNCGDSGLWFLGVPEPDWCKKSGPKIDPCMWSTRGGQGDSAPWVLLRSTQNLRDGVGSSWVLVGRARGCVTGARERSDQVAGLGGS